MIIKREENILTPTLNAKRLFREIYYKERQEEKEEEDTPKIKVSSLISKMAFYYEKIRNAVDYKEEHLLRKNAILRILKRQIVIEGAWHDVKSEPAAKSLLIELIRAAYLPNNKIPEEKIGEIAKAIDKYIKLRKYALHEINSRPHDNNQDRKESLQQFLKEKKALSNWIITMAACDIEERLGRSKVDLEVINYMFETLMKNIELSSDSPFKKDKEIQIYIGIYRNLLKFDEDMAGFLLLKYFNANWNEASEEEIAKIGRSIGSLRKAIAEQLGHPSALQLKRIISSYTVFFSILIDAIKEDPVHVYENFKDDPKAFPRDIKKVCQERYKKAKTKLWRAAVRSIIYIFLTKSIFVFILEIPAIQYFGENINPLSLTINITFPAFLLFLLVLFTKFPGDENTQKVIQGIEEVVFIEKERKEPFKLRPPVRRNATMNTIFGFIYGVVFLLSVSFVIWALDGIGFNWVSIIIFLFFLAFVSYFAIRIRKVARELIIVEAKENIIGLFSDFFYTPIIAAGKWLSEKFSHINVFVFVLDFIIEAPFKVLVEIAEEWTRYVRERKETLE